MNNIQGLNPLVTPLDLMKWSKLGFMDIMCCIFYAVIVSACTVPNPDFSSESRAGSTTSLVGMEIAGMETAGMENAGMENAGI